MEPSAAEIIDRLVELGTAVTESFFIDQGLGQAFSAPNQAWGVRKRVNEALLEAERQGIQEEVLLAAGRRFLTPNSGDRPERGTKVTRSRPRNGKLFIPHASADSELASALADLLRLGTDLTSRDIVCTSLAGMGVPEGTSDYVGYLRGELADAQLVVPLLTPAFFDSDVCLVELGAMWLMELDAFPLVVPPMTFARLEAAIGKVQGGRIDDPRALDRLRDQVVEVFGLDPKTDMWAKNREEFDGELGELLEDLAPSERVPAADLEDANRKLAIARRRVKVLRDELEELRSQFDEVAALKDRDEVEEIVGPSEESQHFESAAVAAQEALAAVPAIVRRSLYLNYGRAEVMHPDQWDSDAAEVAVRQDLLGFDEDSGGYWYNDEDPLIQDALTALRDLFDNVWPEEVEEEFRAKHKKRFGKEIEPTWKALGLL